MTEAGEFAYYLASGAVGLALVLGPVGQAIARRLTSKGSVDPRTGLSTADMAAQRIESLEERVQELEHGAARVAEVEERLDFAERMLAQLPPGSSADGAKLIHEQ